MKMRKISERKQMVGCRNAEIKILIAWKYLIESLFFRINDSLNNNFSRSALRSESSATNVNGVEKVNQETRRESDNTPPIIGPITNPMDSDIKTSPILRAFVLSVLMSTMAACAIGWLPEVNPAMILPAIKRETLFVITAMLARK